jgi:hypothetical protein
LVKGDLQGIVNKELSHAVMKILIKIYFLPFIMYSEPIAAVLYPFGLLLSPMIAALQ